MCPVRCSGQRLSRCDIICMPTEPLSDGMVMVRYLLEYSEGIDLRDFIHWIQQQRFLSNERSLYMRESSGEKRVLTMIPLKPLAPPPLSPALRHISSSAPLVNRISTPEYPKSDWYWERREPLTSVNICRRSGIVRGAKVVIEGRRDTNSGMNLSVS